MNKIFKIFLICQSIFLINPLISTSMPPSDIETFLRLKSEGLGIICKSLIKVNLSRTEKDYAEIATQQDYKVKKKLKTLEKKIKLLNIDNIKSDVIDIQVLDKHLTSCYEDVLNYFEKLKNSNKYDDDSLIIEKEKFIDDFQDLRDSFGQLAKDNLLTIESLSKLKNYL